MHDGILDPWQITYDGFKSSAFDSVEKALEDIIQSDKRELFKSIIGRQFTNTPQSIISTIDQFCSLCDDQMELRSVYLEMNGFDINYHRWYFDIFGYDTDGKGQEEQDMEWLCEWKSPDYPEQTLKGLELCQSEFEYYHDEEIYKDKSYDTAYAAALNLVMCKFVILIRNSLIFCSFNRPLRVLAAAHDFEVTGEVYDFQSASPTSDEGSQS